jgi:mono/diheme cytochrome c family protein
MALRLYSMIVSRTELLRLWETWYKCGAECGIDMGSTMNQRRWIIVALVACLALAALTGCDVERRKSDAELGLNPQQSAGRKLYDNYCDRCHRPDSTKGKKGPGLKGMFQHQYLPQTGLPANDDRVTDIIRNGRPDMAGYGQVLRPQDMQDLLAYLHTL